MFMLPACKLDQTYYISNYRWNQLENFFGTIFGFYDLQFQQSVNNFPSIYTLNIQKAIIRPRPYSIDISPTMFQQDEMILWKCNGTKKYLGFINKSIIDPFIAYKLLQ